MNTPSFDRESESPTDLALLCVCHNTRKAARAVTRLYDELLRPSGLRATQLTLLMFINALGESAISTLADQLVMDRTTLARDLKPMVTAGLVAISAGSDRRTRIIQLTAAGQLALFNALPLWREAQGRLVDTGLGIGAWTQLRSELQQLVTLANG
ncbi:MAG: MarR family winged helix-turn-helix transcriptional regulator [Ktedonobacterales bacterium]